MTNPRTPDSTIAGQDRPVAVVVQQRGEVVRHRGRGQNQAQNASDRAFGEKRERGEHGECEHMYMDAEDELLDVEALFLPVEDGKQERKGGEHEEHGNRQVVQQAGRPEPRPV